LRVPLGNARVKAIGIAANSNEFASDFIYTDAEGGAYHGDPRTLANWYSYGKPIYAPGAGVVKEAANDIPDNRFKDAKAAAIAYPTLPPGKDPQDLGNHVLIDHGNGEFSLLLHMKPGSVRVKAGDHVAQGQQIGALGFSGDAIFPHLHYTLMAGPAVGKDWGIPAYFSHFHRWMGAASVAVARGPVNSGDFAESDIGPSAPAASR
jgi:murein DD-endopeptidase MepM/ murein hydrolase activator NlpD